MKVILIGESFHGVKEFYLYKLAFIKTAVQQRRSMAVVFETDYLGIESLKHEQADLILMHAFPRIFKTNEMKIIIQFLQDHGIPFYGMDCRMRLANNLVPEKHRAEFEFNKLKLESFGSSPGYFDYREEFMQKKVLEIASAHDVDLIICLTHNLHVRIHGSEETHPDLKMKSIREYIDESGVPAESVGLFGMSGTYWEIDLKEKSFHIEHDDAFERSISFQNDEPFEIDARAIDDKYYAYDFGENKESVPVKKNYDKVVLFKNLSKSTLL